MSKQELIISIISFAISLGLSILTIVLKAKANKKIMNYEEVVKLFGETMKLDDFILEALTNAEEVFKRLKGSGLTKKEVVMTKLNQKCIELNIPFNAEYFSEKIDKIIEVTKNINSNR